MEQAPEWPFTLSISNLYGGEEVTNTLRVESREALQSWMEALWQLFFDMSKRKSWAERLGGLEVRVLWESRGECDRSGQLLHESVLSSTPAPGQWKHCCDEVMKIETPAPRKPPQALPKQGSLYHEMGE